jgi:hypothetical protein
MKKHKSCDTVPLNRISSQNKHHLHSRLPDHLLSLWYTEGVVRAYQEIGICETNLLIVEPVGETQVRDENSLGLVKNIDKICQNFDQLNVNQKVIHQGKS